MTKEMKVVIFSLVLLLTVGFATVVSDVLINGNSTVAYDANNFQVLFTNANIEGSGAATIIEDGNAISYTPSTLNNTNDTATVTYNIANNSSLYDANVNLVMKVYDENNVEVDPTDLFTIEQIEGSSEDVVAKTLEEGKFKITLVGDPGEHSYRFVLTKELEAVERTSIAEGDVIPPGIEITFDPNGGKTLTVEKKNVMYNSTYGTLPITTALGQAFEGWYTEPTGGTKVTSDTVITNTADHTLYAHYQDPVATCDGYGYMKLQEAVNNANTDGTLSEIELLKDTTETFNIDSNKIINMDLNNHTVTNPTTNLFTLSNHGNLTVVDGILDGSTAGGYYNNSQMTASNLTVSSSHNAVRNISPGVLTINNNTIEASANTAINNQSALTINGGSYISKGTGYYAIQQNTTATVEITDGYFNSNNGYIMYNQGGTATINGGTFENLSTSTYGLLTSTGTTTINGGTFTNNQTAKVTFYNQSAGTLNVNGGSFTSVSTLFTNYGVMNLGENVEALNISKIVINNSKGTTTVSGGHYSSNSNLISCTGGNVIVNDGTFEGLLSNYPIVVNTATSTADVVINGGTFTSPGSYVIWNRASNMTVNGGTFHTLNNYVVNVSSGANMSITGGSFSNSESTTVKTLVYVEGNADISGGTFDQTTQAIVIYSPESGTITVNEGANITSTNSNTINSKGKVIINGGNISSDASGYPTVYLATPAEGKDPGSIDVNGGNITGASYAIKAETGTVNIKGGTLTTSGENRYILQTDANATLNISGGTFEQASNSSYMIYSNGTTNISGGTFNQSAEKSILFNSSTGSMTIEDGTVLEASVSNAINNLGTLVINDGEINAYSSTYPAVVQQATGSTTINGGTIYSEQSSAIWAKGTVTINDGNISTDKAAGISQSENTTVTITGGTIYSTNNHAVKTAGGTINISGGSLTSSSNNALYLSDNSIANISGGGFTTNSRSAILSTGSTVDITGGTLTSYSNDGLFLTSASSGTVSDGVLTSTSGDGISVLEESTLVISGGTISSDSGDGVYVTGTSQTTIIDGEVSSNTGNAIYIESGSNVTVEGGNIASSADAVNIIGDSTITVEGGTIQSNANNKMALKVVDSTINVTGGSLYSPTGRTIDLNASSLTVTGGTISNAATNSSGAVIYSNADSEMTISGGTITNTSEADYKGYLLYSYGQLTINDGAHLVSNHSGNLVRSHGTTVVNGGNFEGDSNIYFDTYAGSFTISNPLTLEVYRTLINASNTDVIINGGTYSNRYEDTSAYTYDLFVFSDNGNDDVEHTATLNNVTASSNTTGILFNNANSTVTINDGSFSSSANENCTILNFGTLNVLGATIQSENHYALSSKGTATANDDASFIANGDTVVFVQSDSVFNSYNADYSGTSEHIITNYGTANLYDGTTINHATHTAIYSTGNLNIEGGYYHLDNTTSGSSFMIDAYGITSISGGTFVTEDRPLLADDSSGERDSVLNITGGSFTVKDIYEIMILHGTVNISGDSEFYAYGSANIIDVERDGVVTIDGGTYSSNQQYFSVYKGTLTVNADINIDNANDYIFSNSGVLNINAGTYRCTKENKSVVSTSHTTSYSNGVTTENVSLTNITGGTFITVDGNALSNGGTTYITGGSLISESTSTHYTIYNSGNLNISGDVSVINNSSDQWIIDNYTKGQIVIDGGSFSGNTTYFRNRGTLTMNNLHLDAIKDVLVDNYNTTTINGGYYSNEIADTQLITQRYGSSLYLNDGTYRSKSVVVYQVSSSSSIYIDKGTYASTNDSVFHNYGNLNIANAHVESYNENDGYTIFLDNSSTTTITNSDIYSHGTSSAVYTASGSNLTIDSGTLNSENGYSLYLNYGTSTINGGTFKSTGSSAALFNSGTHTLNGGTFTGGTGNYDLFKTSNGSANVTIGNGVVYNTKNW